MLPAVPRPPSLGDFARSVQDRRGSDHRLERGVDLVVEMVDGCDHAGVTVSSRDTLSTLVATDDLVRQGDAWQYELGEGPCWDTVHEEQTVISQSLLTERRWTRWAPLVVAELDIRSMMSLLLYTAQDTFGALNLYAHVPGVWRAEQVAVAHAVAGQLAAAVADAQQIDDRGRAMVSRTVIGQAQGIVMERFGVDADNAFAYLRRVSQTSHRKLVQVAHELVTTRELPGTDEAAAPWPGGGDA